MVRILGEDPELDEDAAMSPGRRWSIPGQSLTGRSPSSARSRSLNKVCSAAPQHPESSADRLCVWLLHHSASDCNLKAMLSPAQAIKDLSHLQAEPAQVLVCCAGC